MLPYQDNFGLSGYSQPFPFIIACHVYLRRTSEAVWRNCRLRCLYFLLPRTGAAS